MPEEKHYIVWVEVEEYIPEKDDYESDPIQVGPNFKTEAEAKALQERLIDCVTDDGEVVWVPPRKEE